jgi:hypothetical protein
VCVRDRHIIDVGEKEGTFRKRYLAMLSEK